MVTLLTDFDADTTAKNQEQLLSLTKKENIDIKHIVKFYENWKSSLKR